MTFTTQPRFEAWHPLRAICRARLLPFLVATTSSFSADAPPNSITFVLPQDGWATIAVNDAGGKRVRNLFGDMPFAAGTHSVEWDGRDDAGKPVAPGEYRWTGLHRGDIAALYRGSFQHGTPPWLYGTTGGWAGDHSSVQALAAVGDRMLLGSNEAEWGHGLIASNLDGRKQWGVKWLDKRAWCGAESLTAAGDRVFATSYLGECAVWEVDPATGRNGLVLEEKDIPEEVRAGQKPNLRVVGGRATLEGGELYLCDVNASKPRTLVFAVPAGRRTDFGATDRLTYLRSLPVRTWSVAWLPDGRCVAALDRSVVCLDVDSGTTQVFTDSPISAPWGIAVDKAGRVIVSDQGATGIHRFTRDGQMSHRFLRLDAPASHQVKIFDSRGKLLRALGREGGRQAGAFDPASFFQPAGIAVDTQGRLWVSELSQSPKRVTVWTLPPDLAAEEPVLAHQFVGPAMYGGGAAMPDPKKPWEILDTNFGVVFDVDLERQSFEVLRVPHVPIDFWKEHGWQPEAPFAGRPGVVIEVEGRRYTALQGGYMHGDDTTWMPHQFSANGPVTIGEYVGDRCVPRAALVNILSWLRGRSLKTRREEQWLAEPFFEAAKRLPDWPRHAETMGLAPDATDVPHWDHPRGAPFFTAVTWPTEVGGAVWVDGNGDSKVQPDEVSFFPMGHGGTFTLDAKLNAFWSIPAWQKEHVGTWTLPCGGFNAHGAPVYRREDVRMLFADEFNARQIGADGSMLGSSALRETDGTLRWSYPSSKEGVKTLGKDSRRTMRPGSIHRAKSMQGVVEGPGDLGPVYLLHSTDGMDCLLTREDGLFIAMLFRPYAFADGWDSLPEATPGLRLDRHSLQDECFNGHFVRAEASGKGFQEGHYYLLGKGRSAVVEVTGLESVARFEGGVLTLVAGQGRFGRGERFDPAEMAQAPATKRTVEPLVALPPKAGEDLFRGKRVEFAGAQVQAAYRGDGLHFKWQLRGEAWRFDNKGSDWTQLFATGGGVEVQVRSPKLGVLRFVAGIHTGEPVIVRMRYEGGDTPDAVTYRSDVHTRRVPEVRIVARGHGIRPIKEGQVVQFRLSWGDLGFEAAPAPGTGIPIELGVFFADRGGARTQSREFWVGGTGMVADLPTEADPARAFGQLLLER